MATPTFMSSVPGPQRRPSAMRHGMCAACRSARRCRDGRAADIGFFASLSARCAGRTVFPEHRRNCAAGGSLTRPPSARAASAAITASVNRGFAIRRRLGEDQFARKFEQRGLFAARTGEQCTHGNFDVGGLRCSQTSLVTSLEAKSPRSNCLPIRNNLELAHKPRRVF